MAKGMYSILRTSLVFFLLQGASLSSFAKKEDSKESLKTAQVGVISSINGSAQLLDGAGKEKVRLKVGDPVNVGDVIQTSARSLAKIKMSGHYTVSIFENTKMGIEKNALVGADSNLFLYLERGQVRATLQKKSKKENPRLQVSTIAAATGANGKDFALEHDVDAQRSILTSFSGAVAFGERDEQGDVSRPMLILQGCQGSLRKGFGFESVKKISTAELRRVQLYAKKKSSKNI